MILSLILFVAYLVYALYTIKEIPPSISTTFYELEKRGKPAWLFRLGMMLPAMILLPFWLEASPDSIRFLCFLACAGLIFVGASPHFRADTERVIHITATIICGASAILWVILMGYWVIPFFTMSLAALLLLKFSKPLFWLEIAAFSSIYLSFLLI